MAQARVSTTKRVAACTTSSGSSSKHSPAAKSAIWRVTWSTVGLLPRAGWRFDAAHHTQASYAGLEGATLALSKSSHWAEGAMVSDAPTMADAEYDVIVVGGGNAALNAAMAARHYAERVLLLERAPAWTRGGKSRCAGVIVA